MVLEAEQKREREVWREQLCSLTRERDCLQRAVGILKRRSNNGERQLQERDLQLLHHMRELEDAKAQIAVLERAVDGWVRRGSSLTQGKKGQGSSPVGKKVLRFASPVRTHIFPNYTSASPKKGPLMQVGDGPPLSRVDTRSVMMRLDQVAKVCPVFLCCALPSCKAVVHPFSAGFGPVLQSHDRHFQCGQ